MISGVLKAFGYDGSKAAMVFGYMEIQTRLTQYPVMKPRKSAPPPALLLC